MMGDRIANKEGFELISFIKSYGQLFFTIIGFLYLIVGYQYKLDDLDSKVKVHAQEIDGIEQSLISIDKNLSKLNSSVEESLKPAIVEIKEDVKYIQSELRRK